MYSLPKGYAIIATDNRKLLFNEFKKGLLSCKTMYLTIDEIFTNVEGSVNAAEAHGIAVGMLSVNALTTVESWLQEIFTSETNLSTSDQTQLIVLFEQTSKLLNAQEFEFTLFLPDDDNELKIRIEALRHWCLGYLAGVGFARSKHNWLGDSEEILKDIIKFTTVDIIAEGEADEQALVDLHEYIRVGVQVIKTQLSEDSVTTIN